MGFEETLDQIGGVLARVGAQHEPRDDGRGYTVRQGAVTVYVTVAPWADGTMVHLGTQIVDELDLTSSEALGKAHAAVNKLNCTRYFAKFCVYEDRRSIDIEHDLLGDDMQAEELVMALVAVGDAAEQAADGLAAEVGGKRVGAEMAPAGDGVVTET